MSKKKTKRSPHAPVAKQDARRSQARPARDRPARDRPARARPGVAALLCVTAFLSAFLLFQVQPMVCKAILPWFGGAPAVWSTGMFFFQFVLLLGYCYAHGLAKIGPVRWRVGLHVALALAAVLLLPIEPSAAWKPHVGDANPTWRLLGLLSRTVGIQFLLLATTAPLVQVWWHRSLGTTPYWLYAISNAGSLLALLTYPFVIEPNLGVQAQIMTWSFLFFLVAGLLVVCNMRAGRAQPSPRSAESAADRGDRPRWIDVSGWLTFSVCGSVLLLAMTNHLTQNVAVVPFLWVLPLALYLISFIICFADRRYYRRWLFGGLMIVSQIACAFLYKFDTVNNITMLLLIHLTALFAGCMVCHGELARMAPPARWLTNFFVTISAGGAVGGFLVSILAPKLFSHYYEYPLVLVACWALFLGRVFRDKRSDLYGGRPRWAWAGVMLACFVFLWYLRSGVIELAQHTLVSRRGFYGVLSIKPFQDSEGGQHMQLVHGVISHGSQYLDDARQYEPTSYYRTESGIGRVMQFIAGREDKRVGMLGLGVGTIAAYCEAGDTFRAYEINSDVVQIATTSEAFTFWSLLEQRGARGEIILGDARLNLELELARGQKQDFDVLVLDVFSGDAIPVHLITLQAFETYLAHLADDGMLAVHISNRHLDLMPVVKSLADATAMECGFINDQQRSEWIIVAPAKTITALARLYPKIVQRLGQNRRPTLWTDDYSDILRVLR